MDEPVIYSESNLMQRLEARYFLGRHLSGRKFEEGCKVLDVGSGDGAVTAMLAQFLGSFQHLLGLDASANMVAFANTRNSDQRVDFRIGDVGVAADLQGFSSVFDYVFSSFCLHWVQDQRQVWKNIYNVLKPGGQVLATFLCDSSVFHVYKIHSTEIKWMPYMKRVNCFVSPYKKEENPTKVLESHLENAGFVMEVCEAVDQVHAYEDEKLIRNFVRSVNPFVGKMSKDLAEEYLVDFLKIHGNLEYVRSKSQPNRESTTVVYQVLHVVATKPLKTI